MACWFGLAAECGGDERVARALEAHFAQGARTRVFRDATGSWWCHVIPAGLSERGPQSADEARAMSERGRELYARLREAPSGVRFALVGVETDEFRTYGEVVAEERLDVFPGLVVDESLWRAVGRRGRFVPFSAGYHWIPYEGEQG